MNNQPQSSAKGMSIAALVLGIAGIVFLFLPVGFLVWLGLAMAVVAIVLGAIAMKKTPKGGDGRGLAIAGFVCGIVATGLAVIVVICTVAAVACAMGSVAGWAANF